MVNCQFFCTEVLVTVFTFIEAVFVRSLFREQTKFVVLGIETLGVYTTIADNAKNGETPDFESYFQPLEGKYIYEWKLIPMKGYGTGKPTFIRLYAIRMEENCYLVVYGGLKLADTIQNSPVLKTEVFKRIDQTLAYLKREGITEQEDLKEEDV